MIRYDVEIKNGFIFKVDIQNPWFHQAHSIGEKVRVRFPIEITLGIPLAQEGADPWARRTIPPRR